MSEQLNNPPAFPHVTQSKSAGSGTIYTHVAEGMSLRDWFAGQALAGVMAQSHGGPKDWTERGWGWGEDTLNSLNRHEGYGASTVAQFAYQIADAMLAEREKQS